MAKPYRIVRNGIPHYCAPWVADLSANARAMIGTGPSRHDPKTQLGLPIPDMESATPQLLDFGPALPSKPRAVPAKPEPQLYVISEAYLNAAIDVQHKLYREGDKSNAQALWNALATVRKA